MKYEVVCAIPETIIRIIEARTLTIAFFGLMRVFIAGEGGNFNGYNITLGSVENIAK